MDYYERNSCKDQSKRKRFPRSLTIGDTKITKRLLIAKILNDFFVNISPKPASVIPNSTKMFQTFLPEINTVLNGTELTENKFVDSFRSFKNDKRSGHDILNTRPYMSHLKAKD